MVALLITECLWMPAIVGMGLLLHALIRRLFPAGNADPVSLGELGLLGFIALGFAGLLLNFVIPLGPAIRVGALLTGYGGLARHWKTLQREVTRYELGAAALLLVTHAFVCLCSNFNFDTGYYHLPSVVWNEQSPVPLGLANLCPWLAYNSTTFIAEAMLALPGLGSTGPFSAPSMTATFFYLVLFRELLQWRAEGGRALQRLVFCGGLFLLANAFCCEIGMLSPNVIARAYAMYGWLRVLRHWEKKTLAAPDAALTVLVSLFAMTAKTFALVSSAGNCLLVLALIFRNIADATDRRRSIVSALAAGGVMGGLWSLRGLLLSGCLLFPQGATCIPGLAWTMPKEKITAVVQALKDLNGAASGSGSLLNRILAYKAPIGGLLAQEPFLRQMAFALGISVFLLLLRKLIRREGVSRIGLCTVVLNASGLIFLLTFAPKPPFLFHHLVPLLSLFVAAILQGVRIPKLNPRAIAFAALFVAIALNVRTGWLTHSKPLAWGSWPDVPDVSVVEEKTVDGSMIYIAPQRLCWDHSAPCVEGFDPNLHASHLIGGRTLFTIPPRSF